MAHNMVIHAANYKKGSVGALEHHNLRENGTYSNKDIDGERTKENIILHQPEVSQYQNTKKIIEQRAVNQVRKNSIWQSEFIISSDKEFFSELPRTEQNRFFQEAYNYLAQEFGEKNVTCASVHYDETTPHMHFDFVPMTEKDKLSRKEVMTRERLLKIQDNLPRYMQEKGFDVTRGFKAAEMDKKYVYRHVDHKEYKKALERQMVTLQRNEKQLDMRKEKLGKAESALQEQINCLNERQKRVNTAQKELQNKASVMSEQFKHLQELPEAEKSFLGKWQLQEQEYKQLHAAAQYGIAVRRDNERLKASYQALMDENAKLKQQIPSVKERMQVGQIKADYENSRKREEHLLEQNKRMKAALRELGKMKLPEEARKVIKPVQVSDNRISR